MALPGNKPGVAPGDLNEVIYYKNHDDFALVSPSLVVFVIATAHPPAETHHGPYVVVVFVIVGCA
jgi:hypothetical protein